MRMKYKKDDIVQEGRFKGLTVIDSYYDYEQPYRSYYKIKVPSGNIRPVDACEIEPDVIEYNKAKYFEYLESKRREKYRNTKYTDSVVNVRIWKINDAELDEREYSYRNLKNLPLKIGDKVFVPVRQRDKQTHDIPALVVKVNIPPEEIIMSEENSCLGSLSIVKGYAKYFKGADEEKIRKVVENYV